MTPRDWVAMGGALLFGGIGLAVWQGATGEGAGVLTFLGAVPLVMGLAAVYELTRGR